MNKQSITNEKKIKSPNLLTSESEKMIKQLSKKFTELSTIYQGIIDNSMDINENYRLDCSEFDDNIVRAKNTVSDLNIKFNDEVILFDQLNGIDQYTKKIEENRDKVINVFVEELNSQKNNLSHQIISDEKDYEVVYKEKNDSLYQHERDLKNDINDVKKKMKFDIQKVEADCVKNCDAFEKELLKTNERQTIKELKEKEKQIRLSCIDDCINIKKQAYLDIHNIEVKRVEESSQNLLNIKKYENDYIKRKNRLTRDITIINEKLAYKETYYKYNTSKEAILYFSNKINELDKKKKSANDQAYLLKKDILSLRNKKNNFVEKELAVVLKKLISLNVEQIDKYYEVQKNYIDLFKQCYTFLDKCTKDNYLQLSKDCYECFLKIVNHFKENNLFLLDNLSIMKIDGIKYVDFPLLNVHKRLCEFVQNDYDENIVLINNFLKKSEDSNVMLEELIEVYKSSMKTIAANESNCFKQIKNCIKNLLTDGKEYISGYCKPNSLEINHDTIDIDEHFSKVSSLDFKLIDDIIRKYQNQINHLNKTVSSEENIISKVGIETNLKYENECCLLDNEYKKLNDDNSKIVVDSIKTIKKEYSLKLQELAKERREEVNKL